MLSGEMKTAIFSWIVLACLIGTVLSQGGPCDPTSDTNDCTNNEVCRVDTCVATTSCDNNRECTESGGYANDACVDYICQPELCSAQGQCAGDDRYQCSNDTMRQCVETWYRYGRVDREARVYFGIVPYDSYVMWYKGSRDNLIITKDTVTGVTTYFNDWCNGTSQCSSSEKGEILSYGWLKIYNVQESDGGYYYWNQNFTNGKEDTGGDYQVDFQVKTKTCDSSDNSACWYDEICRNGLCEKAERCTNNNDTYCAIPNEVCVGTYCQPEFCNADGDCARYKFCTNDTIKRCVRQSFIFGREERERRVYLPDWEPFSEIRWYKNNRDNLIVKYTVNETLYYGDWCSGTSPCNATTKGELEEDGDLTFYNVELSDAAFYFYNLNTTNGKEDPGYDFQIEMQVTPNKCNMSIDQNQCYWDEICRGGKCETAQRCDTDVNCTVGNEVCVSQYCMPEFCSADNECAAYYSYRCSDDTIRRCVRSSYYFSQREGRQASLTLPKSEPFDELRWYKNNRATGLIAEVMSGGAVQYHGSFCETTSPCSTSHRGQLESDGKLVILSAQLNDTDNYFYNLVTTNGADDPGNDYQMLLRVYPDFAPTSQCGGDLSASSGTIESVYYPLDYRNYLRCFWNLNIPMAANIDWEFTDFDLEECCACDYVQFEDSSGNLLHKYCQVNGTAAKFTTPNDVKVSFLTDFTINRPGFQLTWAQNGVITTTAGPTTDGVTTTAGNPGTTTTDGNPGTTTTDDNPGTGGTTTPGDGTTTTEGGGSGVAITPGKLSLFIAAVLVLVFKC